MAVEVCSEISSPRISFSRDLDKTDSVSIEEDRDRQPRLDSSLLDSNSEFNFCIGNNNSFFQEISPADELFSNGKILAVQMKKQIVSTTKKQTHQQNHKSPTIPSSSQNSAEKKIIRLKEFLSMSLDSDDQDQKPSSKSFWQFKRSSSLNCDSTRSKSLIKSLQFLSRSNSTGSAPNPKPEVISKESQKQNLQRQPSVSRKPSSSTGTYYFYSSSNTNYSTLKPPLKKCGSYNGNGGVRISPVLNIAPPCISNATVSGLFGLGSIFCNGKIRKKKR
ncbi:hypothetical protein Ddye_029995 [Dipteronia dyeriana]|uniref:Uncharacterized protein n=1 Tax=Dipteronia dyeriana TaxID=168575 RepID=A0AAD9TDE4_9ROSI|nr:hypothetical protein Ddye_032573 [Dipteronia dyeriana]KAK2633706.1 hypothetical protein Ddye_032577 [Dipteronia dyeriana]KAK2635203.1 hypothetical protein Ddye_029995 [Dipteronia dyeriana]